MSAIHPKPAFRHPIHLPNGMVVDGLGVDDTLMVYRDIFEDDCYRRGGVVLHDGDCVVDVGANTGLFVLFLNTILTDARVYAFEPVPATFQALRRNVERHNHLTARLFNMGLSRNAGRADFTHYPRMSNASTMYPDESDRAADMGRDYVLGRFRSLARPWSDLLALCPMRIRLAIAERVRKHFLKKQTVNCEVCTLSGFLRAQGVDRVDLLKVDAEQSEQAILAGLDDADWPKVRQVVIEVHGGAGAVREMTSLLERRGFRTALESNPTLPALSLLYGVRPERLGGAAS